MSQVDDWSDGYTSDYLRDLNTYGPASANVPRSSVVSHQVRYRAPDTSDIPLAPGQNPEDSVYSNASGARMGQLKPRSGYNPPAGGGYTAKTFPSSGGSGRRYARPKKQTQVSKPAGKTQSAASAKRQVQNYGSYRDLSDPLSQHILANGSPEPKPPVESVVSRAQDITDQSDMYRAIAGLSSPPSANDSQSEVRTAGAGSASVPETNFNRGLMGGVGRQVESMRAPDSEQPAQSVLAGPDESVKFANLPPEMLRDIAERKGRSFAGNLFNDIPWWAFALGGPSNAGMNKAFDFARSKFADAVNSTMRYGSARGAPTESFAQPAASASASWRTGRTAEYPAGTGKLDQFGGWGESGRSAVGTGSAPASDGAAKLGEQTVSYKDSVARLADAGTETAGREVAGADAAAGAAARQGAGEAAGALAPQLQRDLSAVRQKVLSEGDSFERIRDVLRASAGRQELLPANIREACEPLRRIVEQGGGAALTPAEREAVQLYMNRPVASGAAGAAGANGAAGAARGAPQDSVAELANADKVGSTATRTGGSTNTAGWQMTAAETRNEKDALSSFHTIPAGLSPLKLVAEIRSVWAKGVKSGFEDPARMAAAVHEVYGLSPDEATRLVFLIKDGEAGRGALAPLFRSADAYGATLPK